MQLRPRKQFNSTTGRTKADKDQYFLLSPNLDVTERSSSPSARDLRKCIKSTKSPGELLAVLKHADEEVAVEQDTLGTAMQTCGHRMWWDALLEVFEMKNKLRLQIRYTSIVFNALACCLRCDAEKVSACQLLQRKEIAVDLAKKVWQEAHVQNPRDFNNSISAAWKLCRLAGTQEAFKWGDEIWHWTESQRWSLNLISYSCLVTLLEKRKRCTTVDEILENSMIATNLRPNEVVLGGLLNCAAERLDWRRADILWKLLVIERHVPPHFLAYMAYAKAHFLAGRPRAALSIMDSLLATKCALGYKFAVDYLQCCLLVLHASPSRENRQRLSRILKIGPALMESSSASGRLYWNRLVDVAERMRSTGQNPSLRFAGLIVSYLAQQSVMKDWTHLKEES